MSVFSIFRSWSCKFFLKEMLKLEFPGTKIILVLIPFFLKKEEILLAPIEVKLEPIENKVKFFNLFYLLRDKNIIKRHNRILKEQQVNFRN